MYFYTEFIDINMFDTLIRIHTTMNGDDFHLFVCL